MVAESDKADRLDAFADRFEDVVLKNLDWSEVFEKHDSEVMQKSAFHLLYQYHLDFR